jgi:chromate reductase
MGDSVRILGIAGSLRRASYNRGALRAATTLVPAGSTLDVFELDGIPGFNQDDEQSPPAQVVELKQRIRDADAVLFVTPEYTSSVPGVLKNAIPGRRGPTATTPGRGSPPASWARRSAASRRRARSTISDRSWSSSTCTR